MAAVTECTKTDDKCPAGCEQTGLLGCDLCTAGTYNSTAGEKCKPCTIRPQGANSKFLAGDEYAGQTSNTCPWTVTCQANQYWSTGNNFGCTDCPSGYEAKEGNTEFTVNGSGNSGPDADYSKDARCEGKIYDLILKPNSIPGAFVNGEWVTWNEQGFSTDINGGWNKQQLPNSVIPSDRPYQQFLGYYDKTGTDATAYFASNGQFSNTYSKLIALEKPDADNDGRDDITLYARWDFNSFEIIYKSDDTANAQSQTQTCSDKDKFQCTVLDLPSNWLPPTGKVFAQEYKCYYLIDGKQHECTKTSIYHPGEDIPPPDNDEEMTRYFVAQYNECRNGYYCAAGVENKCPAGTTSDAGTSSIEKCYMLTGTNGTQFCDTSNGNEKRCFHLPAQETLPEKIYY